MDPENDVVENGVVKPSEQSVLGAISIFYVGDFRAEGNMADKIFEYLNKREEHFFDELSAKLSKISA